MSVEIEPTEAFLNKICKSFGFEHYKDKKTLIPQYSLILINPPQFFNSIFEEFKEYIPKLKLKDIETTNKCITIIRKLLKTKKLDLLLMKKMKNGNTFIFYKISNIGRRKLIKERYNPKIISFD